LLDDPEDGWIVILNGAPRSGKSSIAAAIVADLSRPWLVLGVDIVMRITPPILQPGIGLRPGGERPDLETIIPGLYAQLFDALAGLSRSGCSVVSDLGIHDGYSRPLGIWDEMERRLAGLPLLRVGVTCPIETIMARRNVDPQGGLYLGGDTVPAPVQRWQDAVHAGKTYDLVVDTAAMSPQECAAIIQARLSG
jgi:chloramphenicol 3-O phosphotransferase